MGQITKVFTKKILTKRALRELKCVPPNFRPCGADEPSDAQALAPFPWSQERPSSRRPCWTARRLSWFGLQITCLYDMDIVDPVRFTEVYADVHCVVRCHTDAECSAGTSMCEACVTLPSSLQFADENPRPPFRKSSWYVCLCLTLPNNL